MKYTNQRMVMAANAIRKFRLIFIGHRFTLIETDKPRKKGNIEKSLSAFAEKW
jgi:hypothetical protein